MKMFRQQNGLVDPKEVPLHWPVLGDKIKKLTFIKIKKKKKKL